MRDIISSEVKLARPEDPEQAQVIAKIEEAYHVLAEASRMEDAQRAWAKAQGVKNLINTLKAQATKYLGSELVRAKAARLHLYMLRRIGQICARMESAQGRRTDLPEGEKFTKAEALKAAGISRTTAHRCETLAAIPEAEFAVQASKSNATVAALVRIGRRYRPKPPRQERGRRVRRVRRVAKHIQEIIHLAGACEEELDRIAGAEDKPEEVAEVLMCLDLCSSAAISALALFRQTPETGDAKLLEPRAGRGRFVVHKELGPFDEVSASDPVQAEVTFSGTGIVWRDSTRPRGGQPTRKKVTGRARQRRPKRTA